MNCVKAYLPGLLLVFCMGCSISNPISGITKRFTSPEASRGETLRPYEYDFVIEVSGMQRSKGHVARSTTTYRDQSAIETRSNESITVIRGDYTSQTNTSRQIITSFDGVALYKYEKRVSNGTRNEQTVVIENGVAVFESWGDDGSNRKELKVPRDVIFDIDPYWLSRQNLRVGSVLEAKCLSFYRKAIMTDRAEVIDYRAVDFHGKTQPAWVVRIISESDPTRPITMIFTAEGELVEGRTNEMVMRVLEPQSEMTAADSAKNANTKRGALDDKAPTPYRVVTEVKLDFPIPAWDTYDRIGLGLTPAQKWASYVHPSEYLDILPEVEGRFDVVLKKVAPSVPGMAVFPIRETPAGLEDFVVSSEHIMSDRPEIRKIAQSITAGQDDAVSAVALLAGWVYQEIRWNAGPQLNQSPLQTLRSHRGDCSEHADLFSSLARSVGIPTRHCAGMLIQKDVAVYHVWVEVYLGGVWVPVDTTVSRVGLPAGYLLTWRDVDGRGELRDAFPRTLLEQGLFIKVLSLGRDGHELNPDDKYSYVSKDEEKGLLCNYYYGFSLTLPEKWSVSMFLKMVKLVSPDTRATVYVEPMPEQVTPSEATINNLMATLKKGLTGFEKVRGDIVPYGAVTKMIRLEFLCTLDGKSMRCIQYVIPRRGRTYRMSCWCPASETEMYQPSFAQVLDSLKI